MIRRRRGLDCGENQVLICSSAWLACNDMFSVGVSGMVLGHFVKGGWQAGLEQSNRIQVPASKPSHPLAFLWCRVCSLSVELGYTNEIRRLIENDSPSTISVDHEQRLQYLAAAGRRDLEPGVVVEGM